MIDKTQPAPLTPDQDRMFHEHMPLAAMLAAVITRKIGRPGLYDDLYQVGLMGLLHSVRRFDATRGSMKGFFTKRVQGAMYDHLRELDPMPRGHRDVLTAIGRLPPGDVSLDHENAPEHASPAPARAMDVADELEWLLRPLTDAQRQLLHLYLVEDRTDYEMAAFFSKSATWIFLQLQQIRELLGERLGMGSERKRLLRKKLLPH